MTAIEKTAAIRDTLAAGLPAELTGASLADFAEYLNKSPLRSDDLELCVYVDFDDNDTDLASFGVVIQAQIYGLDKVQEYHSIIMPFIEEFITGLLVEMTQRISIKSDLWPMEPGGSTGFIYYSIVFNTDLDDCDF